MQQRALDWIRTLPAWAQGWASLALILGAGAAFMFALWFVFMVATYGLDDMF